MQPIDLLELNGYQALSLKQLSRLAEEDLSDLKRREVEIARQLRFYEVKAALWEAASVPHESEKLLIMSLFRIVGKTFGICKLGYHRYIPERCAYRTTLLWTRPQLEPVSPYEFPQELAKLYYGKELISVPKETLPEHQAVIRQMLTAHGEKSLLIAPFSQGLEGADHVFTFCNCEVEREWDTYERSILIELVKIVSSKVGQFQQERLFRTEIKRYQQFVETSDEMHFAVSKDGVFAYLSSNSAKIIGYSPEELQGQSFTAILHPDDVKVARKKFDQVIQESKAYNGNELRVLTKHEGWRWYSVNGAPLKDEKGKTVSYLGSAIEVTAKVMAEQMLERERLQFQELTEKAAGTIVMIDYNGLIQYVNPRGLERSCYPKEALIGRHFLEANLFAPSSHPTLIEVFEKAKKGVSTQGTEAVFFTANRQKMILEVDTVSMGENLLIAMKDITASRMAKEELQKAYDQMEVRVEERTRQLKAINQELNEEIRQRADVEDALRSSREMLRLVIDNIPQFIFWKDRSGRYLGCSQKFSQLVGLASPKELIGKTDRELNWPEEVKDHLAVCDQRVMASNRSEFHLKESRKQQDGIDITYSVNRVPLHDMEGRVIGLLGTYQDITDQLTRDRETLLQERKLMQADRMISLGILSSGIAHEINNPNQFIMSNLSPLRRAWTDAMPILKKYAQEYGDFRIGGMDFELVQERLAKVFDNVVAGSQRIKRIVEELREYNQEIPEGHSEEIQFNRVVRSALILLANQIKKSTHHCEVDLAGELPLLKGNYQRLEQVVINLVQNACQALTDKNDKISIQTDYNEENRSVLLRVVDEGVGIPEDQRERVTDLFYTTKRDMGGVGLGLSISSKIVIEHGGKLVFSPGPERGTEVLLDLPLSLEVH